MTLREVSVRLLAGNNEDDYEIGVLAGQQLTGVLPGDTVRVKASIKYRGPAYSDYFYAAIGSVTLGVFDEIWACTVNSKKGTAYNFSSSADWVTYNMQVDIPITEVGVPPWIPGWFDIYCKIYNKNIVSPTISDKIEVLLQSQFDVFTILSYEKV